MVCQVIGTHQQIKTTKLLLLQNIQSRRGTNLCLALCVLKSITTYLLTAWKRPRRLSQFLVKDSNRSNLQSGSQDKICPAVPLCPLASCIGLCPVCWVPRIIAIGKLYRMYRIIHYRILVQNTYRYYSILYSIPYRIILCRIKTTGFVTQVYTHGQCYSLQCPWPTEWTDNQPAQNCHPASSSHFHWKIQFLPLYLPFPKECRCFYRSHFFTLETRPINVRGLI